MYAQLIFKRQIMFHPLKLSRLEALDVSNREHSGAALVQLHLNKIIIFNFAKVASHQNSDRIIGPNSETKQSMTTPCIN
jgi:hypothetical protein